MTFKKPIPKGKSDRGTYSYEWWGIRSKNTVFFSWNTKIYIHSIKLIIDKVWYKESILCNIQLIHGIY